MSITLVLTCHACVLLYSINAKCIEENKIHGFRYNDKKHHEDKIIRSREHILKRERENHHEHVNEVTRNLNRLKDELTLKEELGRRHLHSHEERHTSPHSNGKEHPNDHVHDKAHREERERRILLSLERKLHKEKREREEKGKRKVTTVHPLFRRRTKTTTGTTDAYDIYTASSGLLRELDEKGKQFTGDSDHYARLYSEEYRNITYPEDKSISSDYASFGKWYEDYQKIPQNDTTPHYAWWTYDPNETCEFGANGVPVNYDRVLYSLKMSSRLSPNISAEIDAMYWQKSEISHEYARKERKSMHDWASREDFTEYNSDAGPVPDRRELMDPFEIAQNRFHDKEYEWGVKLEEDVKNYFVKPALKGLYHVKNWLNPKYTTTTKRIAMTWPSHSMESEEMLGLYKKYLREEKGLNISDEAGLSVFEKYRFTADSNYYDEDTYDMPHHTLNPY
ncbi:hypothetical protein WDU94_015008 [Cyamophila willieti]